MMKTAASYLVLALTLPLVLMIFSCDTTDPDVDPGTHDARLAATPCSIDFGMVPVGTSVDSSFSITMVGSYYTHGMGGDVSLPAGCAGLSILSGEGPFTVSTFWDSVLVRVRCQPSSFGLKMCDVSTGPSGPLVGLRCMGIVDTCLSQPSDLDFGFVTPGSFKDTTFVITMLGSSPGPYSGNVDFLTACPNFDIISGGGSFVLDDLSDTVFVTVRFEPTGVGLRECTITTESECGTVECVGFGITAGLDWEVCSAGGMTVDLFGVWGSSGSNVFIVGDSTTILDYHGDCLFLRIPNVLDPYPLRDIWGTSSMDIWAVGGSYSTGGARILDYHHPVFVEEDFDGMMEHYNCVWGSAACNVYFLGLSVWSVGHNGKHYNCTEWDSVMIDMGMSEIMGVWGTSSSNIWAVLNQSFNPIWHYNGSSWENASQGWMDQPLNDVWVAPTGEVFVVGAIGTIYRYSGGVWTLQTALGMTGDFNGVWGYSPTHVIAVGDGAKIYMFNGSFWIEQDLPGGVTADLNGVWGSSETNAFVVGDDGTILHYGL